MTIRMFSRKSFMLACSLLGGALLMHSCANDFDFEKARGEGDPQYEYKVNFESAFGAIDPDQSWDFAKDCVEYGPSTRADGPVVSEGETETFSRVFRSKVASVLPERQDNYKIGKPYTLISQGPFDIYPLYHGLCMQWDLCVTANNVRTKIGSYSNIMKMMNGSESYAEGDTKDLTTTGWHIDYPKGTTIYIELVITKNDTGFASEDQYAKNGDVITSVYSPAIDITKWWGSSEKRELANGSLVLPKEKYEDIYSKANLDMIIMFEDSNTKNCDRDFNDFVIGIKGRPTKPTEIKVETENKTTFYEKEVTTTKRYMVEDLGAVNKTDIDFNDLVIDFEEIRTEKYAIETVEITEKQDGVTIGSNKIRTEKLVDTKYAQTATVRALGGTLDLEVCLKNTDGLETPIFQKGGAPLPGVKLNKGYNHEGINIGSKLDVATMYNTGAYPQNGGEDKWTPDYDGWIAEIDLGDQRKWRPEDNNIVVKVTNRDETVTKIDFPEKGNVPCMVAVGQDQKWNYERVSVFSAKGQFGNDFPLKDLIKYHKE